MSNAPDAQQPSMQALYQAYGGGSPRRTSGLDVGNCRTGATPVAAVSPQICHPAHYTNGGAIECWDYIVSQNLGYLAGNIVKYITRYRWKTTPVQDLLKARAYLDRLIAEEERMASTQQTA
jgi:hypothetical protein